MSLLPDLEDFMAHAREDDPDNGRAPPGVQVDDTIPHGRRNSTLASYAGTMRRQGLSADAIAAALKVENGIRCEPPLDETEVEKIARSIGRYAPAAEAASASRPVDRPTEADLPRALDVVDLAAAAPENDEDDAVIADLLLVGQVLAITGEEGDGKTTMAEQAIRQLVRGERIWDFFEPGRVPVDRVLFVDTEMEEPEIRRRCADLDARGLEVPADRFFWLCAGGLELSRSEADRAYIRDQMASVGAGLLWLDAGGGAVDDPKDDTSVGRVFDFLSDLIRSGLLAAGLTLHPRKRAQGEYGRRFDDLFGSREWKGRSTKVLYLDDSNVWGWKDRGRHLHRRWPVEPGQRYPRASLDRPGTTDDSVPPFVVRYDPKAVADDRVSIRAKVLELVGERPAELTKTGIADRLGGRRADVLAVVGELLGEQTLGPDKRGAKLSVQSHREPNATLVDEEEREA